MLVRWYIATPLSYRQIEDIATDFNLSLDHSTVQRWVDEYSPAILNIVHRYMNKDFTRSWRLDETYIKVKGRWNYLYRIVDSKGDSINFYLSETRNHKAALNCIRGAMRIAGIKPNQTVYSNINGRVLSSASQFSTITA